MAKIGVQAMMLKGKVSELGAYDTLARIADIGYHAVEVSQIPMDEANVAEMARARAELGIEFGALSTALDAGPEGSADALTSEFDKIVADAKVLGATNLRIGMLPLALLESLDQVLDFCRRSDEQALRLAEHGISLYYHNHHIEFMKFDGRSLLDIINETAPNMRLELDVHWVQRGGNDPVRTLRKYADRADLVHLKDYRIGAIAPEAFKALADGDRSAFMKAFSEVVQFAEVGEGTLDFRAIVEQSVANGVKYMFVEQDQLYGRDVFDALKTSYDNLVDLGFADLF
ncbi:sugar phosphate isomerase/epimerase [Occultella aeris]|uniref:Inosose dehydratase n=1 Tax=Occultella aeris TaxID=2761496 RepID=A0A7M4DKE8_9MICO|nr:sugar phosphate isomerase/epimerase [Occultella aeris]VZO37615.1 Inosose dehydratase [Occultella aeris]